MIKGRASDIFPDGTQLDYPVSATTEPRDIKWRGNELLMVDGAKFSIKRYSDERVPMDDFGDTQVQDDLKRSFYQRSRLQNQYKLYIGGAILFFLIGFGFALRAQLMEKAASLGGTEGRSVAIGNTDIVASHSTSRHAGTYVALVSDSRRVRASVGVPVQGQGLSGNTDDRSSHDIAAVSAISIFDPPQR